MTERDSYFMQKAISLARKGADSNSGGPFGAVIVKDDVIVGKGYNKVTSTNDPTAHAEIVAIKEACEKLNSFQLENCVIYTSCEPCPMCLGAIYWARLKKVFYACNREDASIINFDDQIIYDELKKPIDDRQIAFINLMRQEALSVFKEWSNKPDKIDY
jgi:tRNA(Arg) A34 adenosine deaminase TadA